MISRKGMVMAYLHSSSACGVSARPTSFMARIRHAIALGRSRSQLAGLTDEQLADIGISRAQANEESKKSPWDGPDHWVKQTY